MRKRVPERKRKLSAWKASKVVTLRLMRYLFVGMISKVVSSSCHVRALLLNQRRKGLEPINLALDYVDTLSSVSHIVTSLRTEARRLS